MLNPWSTPINDEGTDFAHASMYKAGPMVAFSVVRTAVGLKPFEYKSKASVFKALGRHPHYHGGEAFLYVAWCKVATGVEPDVTGEDFGFKAQFETQFEA